MCEQPEGRLRHLMKTRCVCVMNLLAAVPMVMTMTTTMTYDDKIMIARSGGHDDDYQMKMNILAMTIVMEILSLATVLTVMVLTTMMMPRRR